MNIALLVGVTCGVIIAVSRLCNTTMWRANMSHCHIYYRLPTTSIGFDCRQLKCSITDTWYVGQIRVFQLLVLANMRKSVLKNNPFRRNSHLSLLNNGDYSIFLTVRILYGGDTDQDLIFRYTMRRLFQRCTDEQWLHITQSPVSWYKLRK